MVSAMKLSAALPGTPADALEIFTSRGVEQPVPHRLPSSCRGQTVPDLQRRSEQVTIPTCSVAPREQETFVTDQHMRQELAPRPLPIYTVLSCETANFGWTCIITTRASRREQPAGRPGRTADWRSYVSLGYGGRSLSGGGPGVDDTPQAQSVPNRRHEVRHSLFAQALERASGHLYVRPRRTELFCRPAVAEDALPRDVGT